MIAGVGEALLPVLMPEEPASTNPANEVARKLTGRDYLIWSSVNLFRQWPLRYRFKFIDGLPEESVASAVVFGTGIHSAVEQHFQAILSGEEQPDIERLMFAYRSAWLPHAPDAIQFVYRRFWISHWLRPLRMSHQWLPRRFDKPGRLPSIRRCSTTRSR